MFAYGLFVADVFVEPHPASRRVFHVRGRIVLALVFCLSVPRLCHHGR